MKKDQKKPSGGSKKDQKKPSKTTVAPTESQPMDSRATNSPETRKPNFPANKENIGNDPANPDTGNREARESAPLVAGPSSAGTPEYEETTVNKRDAKASEGYATGSEGSEASSSTSSESSRNPGNIKDKDHSALHQLFITELKDIYWAEQHLVNKLPGIAEKADSPELRKAIENHLEETKKQVERLQQVFESINEEAKGRMCEAMNGLTSEAERTIDETEPNTKTRDVAIISCAQKVEHYEIATYGTLRTLASIMNYSEAENLLSETLKEEKGADKKLTEIAKDFVNKEAVTEEVH